MRARSQRGAALIIALVMLVIMTMLGLTTMNTSVVEERMAGNVRNREVSFDAAEAAVREAEDTIFNGDYYAMSPKNGTDNPVYEPQLDPANPDWWQLGDWWDPGAENTAAGWQEREGDIGMDDEDVVGATAAMPQYLVEYLSFFTRDLNCGVDIQAAATQDCYRYAYRITGRGWGANTNAVTVVQSVYADRN
jgi:type IV pilus assembly protein PilX